MSYSYCFYVAGLPFGSLEECREVLIDIFKEKVGDVDVLVYPLKNRRGDFYGTAYVYVYPSIELSDIALEKILYKINSENKFIVKEIKCSLRIDKDSRADKIKRDIDIDEDEDGSGPYRKSIRATFSPSAWNRNDRIVALDNYKNAHPEGYNAVDDTCICYGPLCRGKKTYPRKEMTIDHIEPFARLFNRTSNINSRDKLNALYKRESNLTLLCKRCNSSKSSGGVEYDSDKVRDYFLAISSKRSYRK